MTTLQTINASSSPEVQMNENVETLSAAGIFGKKQPTTTGLTWGYYGGRYNGNTVADGTVTLTDSATNYLVVSRSTGTVSVSTSTTNWNDTDDYAKLYQLTTSGGVVTATVDSRFDTGGLLNGGGGGGGGGGGETPLTSHSSAYAIVLGDANSIILHPSADTTPRVWTIPANSSVAFPVGTSITFVNQNGAGTLTISITTDTMRLAGAGTPGSRTLAENGIATALKLTSTEWLISGVGLT